MQLNVDFAVYKILRPSVLLCTRMSAIGVLTVTDMNGPQLHFDALSLCLLLLSGISATLAPADPLRCHKT